MFYSFGHMPLADAMAISFSVTLFSVIFALPILKERPTQKHLFAVLLGFAGVLFIAKPTGNVWSIAALCGILGAAMDSITLTTGRKLALRQVTAEQTSFYFCIVATIASAVTLPFSGVMPCGIDWAMLFLLGFGGGVGQYCITKGFAMAPAAVGAPMIYTASVWSVLIGYIFWDEVPILTTIIGMSMIIAGGIYIGYLQSSKKTALS
jgi:drug/metabolite transporter (DMT)-like permease